MRNLLDLWFFLESKCMFFVSRSLVYGIWLATPVESSLLEVFRYTAILNGDYIWFLPIVFCSNL